MIKRQVNVVWSLILKSTRGLRCVASQASVAAAVAGGSAVVAVVVVLVLVVWMWWVAVQTW